MPYITHKRRQPLIPHVESLLDTLLAQDNEDGDINFVITMLLDRFYDLKNTRYSKIKDAEGTLVCVALELYRRRAEEYEDEKRKKNGDVFES